jgi:hypothetical protein
MFQWRPLTEQASCPWAWWWCASREWHTSWCPQTIQQGKLPKPPRGQVQPCFGNDSPTWTLEQPLVPNIGMAPCKSKGQPTFGISGSLEADIERNVKVVFRVRVWPTVCLLLRHIYIGLTATVPGRYRWGFLMPPADGNAFLAAFVANALRGTFPPLDFLAICLVRAMVAFCCNYDGWKCCVFTSVWVMVVFFVLRVRRHALKISGHRSRTVIFVFLISIMSKSGSPS